MMHPSGLSQLAVATGIIGSAWVSGAIVSFSIAGAPAAAAVRRTSAQTWAELYKRGAASMPKFAAAAALSYLLAAYEAHGSGGSWKMLAGAAGCVLSIVPFTLLVMKGTNDALHAAAAAAAAAKESRVSSSTKGVADLLDRWVLFNWARGLLPLVGTGLGCVAFRRDAL